MKIKHIFFDLDHTLWDFEKNSDLAFKTIFKKHKVHVEFEKFANYYRPINQKYWKLYRDEKVSKSELRYGRLKDTFTKIKFEVSDSVINSLAVDYIDVLPNNNYLFDGAIEILNYLQPSYKLHIITNGFNEVQYQKIENSGLKSYFSKIITSEEVGVKKPNPKIFKYALDKAEALSKESLMIGDNWEADIMGAKNIGLDVIFFNIGNQPVSENIKSIDNLYAIKKFL
ncbi:YjjG family noncanonical pyrimidine nucleotidase [Lutibacter sp. TH_r2]|uniref:YjjG family noncanonical pyrimidine nucleotidase n=1 Tax=Lutibacter sp. TH_r2 TaxID=3082083 RepID=UPI0029532B7A|nr:YjjG family noncanonical pyrimidine nucleotidase [Lutibacter sp. TH_r2]MDV7185775.1 YjjG family noncanonical pyrimidine nucleotidase [Lutibacter sp. TH_r2]